MAGPYVEKLEDLVRELAQRAVVEHRFANVELKESWDRKYGSDVSSHANRPHQSVGWIVVGVTNKGELCGKPEKWARTTEEQISQHFNQFLDPALACTGITCAEVAGSWIIVISVKNPGVVVRWNKQAYKAPGSTDAVMTPDEVLEMTVALPGLTDYTKQPWTGPIDERLAAAFKAAIRTSDKGAFLALAPADVLARLQIRDKNVAGILFGDRRFRVVRFDKAGNPTANDEHAGLFQLLTDEFRNEIQSWTKAASGIADQPYSDRALKEALANAVAHAAYMENQGEVILELYPGRVVVTNLCHPEAKFFANKWFSRAHKTLNNLLMEVMRSCGAVDELGLGKGLIFRESIVNGREPPQVQVEAAGRFDRWKLFLFGGASDKIRLRLLERLRATYPGDEQRALFATALVLWRGEPVSSLKKYLDAASLTLFTELLRDANSPVFYAEQEDRLILRRWASVLLGEGKDSKKLTGAEEADLLQRAAVEQRAAGEITAKQLRSLAGMGDSDSEKVLLSNLVKKWKTDGRAVEVGKGRYRVTAPTTIDFKDMFQALGKLLNIPLDKKPST